MDPAPTKARLLEAAALVFLRHGFAGASMELVRQEAGVSNGSLYHHYPTKAQLADALYAHTLRELHAALLVPIAGRAGAATGVTGLVREYVQWVLGHPAGARLLHELRRSGGLHGGAGEWEQANAEGFGALRAWVERKTGSGEMRPLPFAVWTACVFAPAMTLTRHWLDQSPPHVAPAVRRALEHAAWMAVAP